MSEGNGPSRGKALGVLLRVIGTSFALAATFSLGATWQDGRARAAYVREGKISAYYDMSFAGYMLYLGCLSDRCEHERADSEAITSKAHEYLAAEGVTP